MAEARSMANFVKIDFDEIHNREIVGRGSFGTVYKARWKNQDVAVKEFYGNAEPKAIETEVKQLSRVDHPNIISLYGVSEKESFVYLIMEFAPGGSLHNFLHGNAKPYYSVAHAMNWALQCAEGVAYLHAMTPKPLIHRDLKPPNLLLVNHGRNLKICDFGTVADKSTRMTNNKGSAAWMAPEVFESSSYTEKCDVFSWGIILWELLTRRQPFKEVEHALTIMWGVHKGHRPPLIEGCPKPIEDLYTSCWSQNPTQRPSMKHIVEIMTSLCEFFPGAQQPLDYKSSLIPQQQPKDLTETNTTLGNTRASSSPWSSSSNQDSVRNLANMFNSLSQANNANSAGKRSPRFSPSVSTSTLNPDSIPEEKEVPPKVDDYSPDNSNDPFRLKPSPEAAKRSETIRNGILKRGHLPMVALSVDIDHNAWELKNEGMSDLFDTSKSDGKERLTVTETKPVIPDDDDDLANASSGNNDYEADQSLHQMLDSSLQPVAPIPNNRLSQEIYQDHTRLAKEYLRVDTELCYVIAHRDKYLAALDPVEREQKLNLMKKLEEKNELFELYNDLKQQLERMRAAQHQNQNNSDPQTSRAQIKQLMTRRSTDSLATEASEDGWVVIPPKENNT